MRPYNKQAGINHSEPIFRWWSGERPLAAATHEQADAIATALTEDPCPTVSDVRAYTRDAGLELSDDAAHWLLHQDEHVRSTSGHEGKYLDFFREAQQAELSRYGVRFPHEYPAARRWAQTQGGGAR